MAPSLKPVRVLATRPQAQNLQWCQQLEEAGLTCLSVPVLEIKAVQEPEQRRAIKNLILDFDQFDKVIFVSQNAVRETFAWLDEFWPQLPTGIHYFAVGKTTAQLLREQGVSATSGEAAMDSDELLALAPLQQVEGQKILICRGLGGRPRLAQELEARGARVVLGEFYLRVLPRAAEDVLRQSDFASGKYRELLSAFSGESLANLVMVLKQAEVASWRQLPLLVPGERVAEQARHLGFTQVVCAANATDAAMLEALTSWLSHSN